MAFESFVAIKYLRKRNMSRFLSFMTSVAIGSVAIGVAALIIAFTILDGFERELKSNIIGFAAHIQVGTFRNQIVRDDEANIEKLRTVSNVAKASPFLQGESIAITRDNIDGVFVKGVLPEGEISNVRDRIVAGEYLLEEKNGASSIIIGRRLADKLGLKVSDKMVLIGVSNMEELFTAPKRVFVIRGIYETGMAEYFDDLYVFTSVQSAQKLFALPAQINGYDVLCSSTEEIDPTVERIQETLGYPFDPRSIFNIYRNLFIWIDLQQELIPIVVGSLILISVFNIIATLLLFVIEKTDNIGILMALGASRRSIMKIFVAQGLVIGAFGAMIGCVISFILSYAQKELRFFSLPQDVYYMTTVPIHISLEVYLLTSFIAIALALVASFIPAWLGARLDPIKCLRFH